MKDLEPNSIVSEAGTIAGQNAQTEMEIRNASIRQAERQAKIDAWQDPEAMAYRKAVHDKGAMESLWALREAGQCEADTPLPDDAELPSYMRGQQPSTVRAWLRGQPNWRAKIKAHQEAAEIKRTATRNIKEKHPELYGIDFTKLRRETAVVFGDEHKVRDGKRMQHSEWTPPDPTPTSPEAPPPKGLVARVFAGIWKK